MPGTREQNITAAIALHHPEKLYKRNRGFLKMKKEELEEFAKGSHSGPRKLRKKSKKGE